MVSIKGNLSGRCGNMAQELRATGARLGPFKKAGRCLGGPTKSWRSGLRRLGFRVLGFRV